MATARDRALSRPSRPSPQNLDNLAVIFGPCLSCTVRATTIALLNWPGKRNGRYTSLLKVSMIPGCLLTLKGFAPQSIDLLCTPVRQLSERVPKGSARYRGSGRTD